MKLFGFDIRREERAAVENPAVPLNSAAAWASLFQSWGGGSGAGAAVTVETALGVPAVFSAVSFLSRTMATLPLHAYRHTEKGATRIKGGIQTLIHEAPNAEWTSFDWREYLFWQAFTEGRGLSWIERSGTNLVGIWPMVTACTTIRLQNGRKTYVYAEEGVPTKTYPASDVIDLPFALKSDRVTAYSPIDKCRNAIGLAIAMEAYAGNFFKGGGVPPLALVGQLGTGNEAIKRSINDVHRAIEVARSSNKPIFPLPASYDLKPVGIDPEKGQMGEARLMQIQEIARAFQLPPVFLQDLSKGTFANTEQQDLFFVKHLIGQWAKKFEQQMNLKLFGQRNSGRYVEHNLDGLQRGDFKSRIEGLARAIQTAQMTPDEARALENRPAHSNPAAKELLVQGATVVLGSSPPAGHNGGPPLDDPPKDGQENDAEA
ncbi:phage portal protein [Ancylobacter oerskovii]|uniref:Phage portal protein n=1 Tax=Ancylobacter oerskovii TaxID=459519 RepID=A0ABW4Z1E0_9HYPH|nr:phage portal protein [Ancylobacter oerskovii]MBS7545109.1 phage portal protein [Ancylobacter oerskovii]